MTARQHLLENIMTFLEENTYVGDCPEGDQNYQLASEIQEGIGEVVKQALDTLPSALMYPNIDRATSEGGKVDLLYNAGHVRATLVQTQGARLSEEAIHGTLHDALMSLDHALSVLCVSPDVPTTKETTDLPHSEGMANEERKATRAQGVRANLSGIGYGDSPYTANSPRASYWKRGWQAAQSFVNQL